MGAIAPQSDVTQLSHAPIRPLFMSGRRLETTGKRRLARLRIVSMERAWDEVIAKKTSSQMTTRAFERDVRAKDAIGLLYTNREADCCGRADPPRSAKGG